MGGGAGIDLIALIVIATDLDGHLGRLALGVMMPATAVGLLGIVLGLIGANRLHFDASIAKNEQRLGVLEQHDEQRTLSAYRFGLEQRATMGEPQNGQVRH